MFIKITSLATLPDFILLVGFASGEYKQFDIKPLIDKYPPFKSLIGVIKQKPPIYSAVSVNGKRLYEYARENLEVEIKEREIEIQN